MLVLVLLSEVVEVNADVGDGDVLEVVDVLELVLGSVLECMDELEPVGVLVGVDVGGDVLPSADGGWVTIALSALSAQTADSTRTRSTPPLPCSAMSRGISGKFVMLSMSEEVSHGDSVAGGKRDREEGVRQG